MIAKYSFCVNILHDLHIWLLFLQKQKYEGARGITHTHTSSGHTDGTPAKACTKTWQLEALSPSTARMRPSHQVCPPVIQI